MALAEILRFYEALPDLHAVREALARRADPRCGTIEPADVAEVARAAGFAVMPIDVIEHRNVRRSGGPMRLLGPDELRCVAGGSGAPQFDLALRGNIVQSYPGVEYDFLPRRP